MLKCFFNYLDWKFEEGIIKYRPQPNRMVYYFYFFGESSGFQIYVELTMDGKVYDSNVLSIIKNDVNKFFYRYDNSDYVKEIILAWAANKIVDFNRKNNLVAYHFFNTSDLVYVM